MKKEITKRIPSNEAAIITFDIYEGFSDVEQVETQMCNLQMFEKHYVIINFMGKYYGVANHNASKALVIGKEVSWVKESNIWTRVNTSEIVLPFKPGTLSKGSMANQEIIRDLTELDPEFKILNGYKTGWKDIRDSYQYSTYFAELLGRTFYDTFFKKEDLQLLTYYNIISKTAMNKTMENKRIEGINPFRTEALFISGRTHRILM